jgi:hypothetical protein
MIVAIRLTAIRFGRPSARPSGAGSFATAVGRPSRPGRQLSVSRDQCSPGGSRRRCPPTLLAHGAAERAGFQVASTARLASLVRLGGLSQADRKARGCVPPVAEREWLGSDTRCRPSRRASRARRPAPVWSTSADLPRGPHRVRVLRSGRWRGSADDRAEEEDAGACGPASCQQGRWEGTVGQDSQNRRPDAGGDAEEEDQCGPYAEQRILGGLRGIRLIHVGSYGGEGRSPRCMSTCGPRLTAIPARRIPATRVRCPHRSDIGRGDGKGRTARGGAHEGHRAAGRGVPA